MDEVKTEEEPKKRGRKPEPKKLSTVAIEIDCLAADREKAAEEKFMELMDGSGGVMAVNPSCGGSTYFATAEEFPKVNRRCTCGQVGHYMVKYNLK